MPPASVLLNSQRDLCSVIVKWDTEPFDNPAGDFCKQILKIRIFLNLSNMLILLTGTSKVVLIMFSLALHLKSLFLGSKRCLSNDQSS